MNIIQDDRTPAQLKTHTIIIGGSDPGMCRACFDTLTPRSAAYWATTPQNANSMAKWIRARGDIKNVKRATLASLKDLAKTHVHIYVKDHA